MPESIEERFTRADRDMLIITNSTVLDIKEDVRRLQDNVVGRVEKLELCKVDNVVIGTCFVRTDWAGKLYELK